MGRGTKVKFGMGNEVIKGLLEAINQRDDPQLHKDVRKFVTEQIDELKLMNDGAGPAAVSADLELLEMLSQLIERADIDVKAYPVSD